MNRNYHTFRAIVLLFICMSLTSNLVSGKPSKYVSYTRAAPLNQNLRTITVGRNSVQLLNNNNNQKSINLTKVSAKSDVNSGSDTYSDSMSSVSQDSQWSLKFDPNYFASLNAANHRPIDAMIASPTDDQSKVSSTSSSSSSPSSGENMFYYSPESYGKTNYKNHKTNSFAYLYPSSSSTTTTTTSTSTTPSPKTSHNRFGDLSSEGLQRVHSEGSQRVHSEGSQGNSESEPQFRQSFSSDDKHSSVNYSYEDTPEEPTYYATNEELDRKYYYPNKNIVEKNRMNQNYGSEHTTNQNSKMNSVVNSGSVPSYGAQEGTDADTYQNEGKVGFPSQYYDSGISDYDPSHFSSHDSSTSALEQLNSNFLNLNNMNSNDLNSDNDLDSSSELTRGPVRTGTWLGPGIAGLIIGILPLATLIASMIPAFISIPVISTSPFSRRRRHISDLDLLSFNETQFINPEILEKMPKTEMSSLDLKCFSGIFCKSTEERHYFKNLIQNIVYDLIHNMTSGRLTKWLSMDTLTNASNILSKIFNLQVIND